MKKSTVPTSMMPARSRSVKALMAGKPCHEESHDAMTMNMTNFSLYSWGPLFGQIPGFFPEPRDDRPLRFKKGDDDEPDGKNHKEAHGGHIIDEFEEADVVAVNSLNIPAAATPRAAPRKVIMEPAPRPRPYR